eukprot:SAG22_NODE_2336_length_2697_cov_2.088496_1_plen_428_part_00
MRAGRPADSAETCRLGGSDGSGCPRRPAQAGGHRGGAAPAGSRSCCAKVMRRGRGTPGPRALLLAACFLAGKTCSASDSSQPAAPWQQPPATACMPHASTEHRLLVALPGHLHRAAAKECKSDGDCATNGHGKCNGYASHPIAKDKMGSCSCKPGWSGAESGCTTQLCPPGKCKNGGSCSQGTCTCAAGCSGSTCTTDACSPTPAGPCKNSGICSRGPGPGHYTCHCADGYDGNTCQTNLCSPNPCQHGGSCSPGTGASYRCACSSTGWQGPTCQTCAKPCTSEVPDKSTKTCGGKSCAAQVCPADKCYQGTCAATCRAGYSGTAVSYTCDIHGSWAPAAAALACSAKPCSGAPTANSNTVTGTFEDTKTITVACKSGYYSQGTGQYSCQLTGSGGAVGWLPVGSQGSTCLPSPVSTALVGVDGCGP